MAKKFNDYAKDIERALKRVGRYNKGLSFQIEALASAMRTLDLGIQEMDTLEATTIPVITRYGNESIAPHPVFKILKDAQESITKQMKALGLTTEDLSGTDDNDPLVDLTKQVRSAARSKPTIHRPDPAE